MPDPGVADRDRAAKALLGALQRLTAIAADTSRDPRTAIVQKLATVLQPDSAGGLFDYMGDYDPRVRAAASGALGKLIGSLPTVVPKPQHRYPLQPSSLATLPATARITMADGATIDLELLVNDAPVTVARFADLARGGYYNGLTFHRIAPNFVVQGGSPGANEYAGVARYMRDEIGAHHVRGAVGISTRGRDTGDMQIFIDHVDVPRLDHEYTVFARVITGMEHVDRMLEGATMRTVNIK
jgi:cyclophilin family peptidyl-prolyl cis-trans isomerase